MWRRWDTSQNFLVVFTDELWKTWKIRILKKWEKLAGELIILHRCTKNHNHMWYSSWDTKWDNFFFVILDHFLPFMPPAPNNSENKFWKFQKSIWRCHHFKLVQQKTRSNHVCLFTYEVQQTFFFVILGHFFLFHPTIDPENEIWKKCKKHLEILSFCTCSP